VRRRRDAQKWASAKYCSPKCSEHARRKMDTKACIQCGALMSRQPRLSTVEWNAKKLCSVKCRGDNRHYESSQRPGITLAERVLMGCHPEPMSGCWLWVRVVGKQGYGRLTVDGRRTAAHRASYEAFVGPIPPALVIDHLCATACCVNPDHLEAVTNAENIRRGRHGHTHSTGRVSMSSEIESLKQRVSDLEAHLLLISEALTPPG